MHGRIGNVFHVDRNIPILRRKLSIIISEKKRINLSLPFPNAEALIVGRRNETTIIVDESDGIDSA